MPIAAFANPGKFMRLSDRLRPWLAGATALCFVYGFYLAWFASPPDAVQGETVRIMYIHVPAAWTALLIYSSMAIAAVVGFVWRHTLTDIFCCAAAPIGAVVTAICLITGSIWGQPTWGTWWVWDARLTSVLILLFLYLGYILLRRSFEDHDKGGKAGAFLLLIGAANIPIIHFSVQWWNTLHQPASIFRMDGPTISPSMLHPLFVMAFAYLFFTVYVVLLRMKSELLARRIEAALLKQSSD